MGGIKKGLRQVRREHRKSSRRNYRSVRERTERIFMAIMRLRAENRRITVKGIVKEADISIYTFYMRFHNYQHAVAKHIEMLADECMDIVAGVEDLDRIESGKLGKSLSIMERTRLKAVKDINRQKIMAAMIHMGGHREIYYLATKCHANREVICVIGERVADALEPAWTPETPKQDSMEMRLFIAELTEILMEWAKRTRCDEKKAEGYINKIMKLVNNPGRCCGY